MSSINDLKPDKKNARKHNQRNLEMIQKSFSEVGTGRSIVIDEENNVLAGNGTVESFKKNGKTKIQIVDADGDTLIAVRRTGLTQEQKTKLALYDNRSNELSEWDMSVLNLLKDEVDIKSMFSDDEFKELMGEPILPSGCIYELLINPEMNHKKYFEDLQIYLQKEKEICNDSNCKSTKIRERAEFVISNSINLKPSISELEEMIEKYGKHSVYLKPDGTVLINRKV